VRADLDTLVIALYVTIDELLAPRRGPGRRPKLSDAELVCLAVAQVLLGFGSERRWLRFAGQRLGHLFPYLPTASAYNRRLRRAAPLVALAIQDIAAHTPSWGDQLRLVDSTPVPCASSRDTVKRSALAGHADYGYCKSHHRYFWGFRLYLLAAGDGLPVAWCLATPSWASVRSWRPCWTTSAPGCARAWSSWATRALPVASSTSSSPTMAPGCCVPTAPMSRAGWGRWAGSGSGSRAPSRPSRASSGWNATAAAPLPGLGSGRAAAAGLGHRDLVELGDRRTRQALPGRLRPLLPSTDSESII
jgi:hypothetical protein